MKKETVVYLSNECVKLIVGSDDQHDMVRINDFQSYPFAEGTMINGVITDENEIKRVLKTVASAGYTKVSLVIDSGQILSKSSVMPAMAKKQILSFVQDELASLGENSEDLVYDYAYLGTSDKGKGASQILCCAVERKLITNYLELFKECGIDILAIDFSINILSKLTQELTGFDNKTYLISLLDGNNLTSVLFENNQYKLTYRARIISERKDDAFLEEIVSNIAHIYQFSKSGENSIAINKVLFCGLGQHEEVIKERIQSNINIEAEEFPTVRSIYVVDRMRTASFHLDEYILPVGFLFRK